MPITLVSMSIGARVHTGLDTSVRVDPRVLLSARLIQLSSLDLEQAIATELDENPALERLEDAEPITEASIIRALNLASGPDRDDYEANRSRPTDDDMPHWSEMTAGLSSLTDCLTAQLIPLLSDELKPLGHYLIGSLQESGYLLEPEEEIALANNVPLEWVQEVSRLLRTCEPAGVGARNVQECLLLQLKDLDETENRLARRIVKDHLDDLIAKRFDRIQKRYDVPVELVEQAFKIVLALTPFPAANFGKVTRAPSVTTELELERTETGWRVKVCGPEPGSLKISHSYRRRIKDLKGKKGDLKDERRHLEHYTNRAQEFISAVEQRRVTMLRIGEYLLAQQAGFVTTGRYEFLKPLTRTKLAADLEMHESSVSRAMNGKFLRIGNGEVLSFDVFFKPALKVHKIIEEILADENPIHPMSDARLVEMLAQRGIHIARRTVNKYRDQSKLASSRRRKSA